MSSLTGLASSSITSMIPGLCTAGQMKLVGATTTSLFTTGGTNGGNVNVTPPSSITIPALTGSQVAIVYLEVTISIGRVNGQSVSFPIGAAGLLSATGTGINVSVNAGTATGFGPSANPAGAPSTKGTAFGTTSTGNQTVTFTSSFDSQNNGYYCAYAAQACVFIYSPPF